MTIRPAYAPKAAPVPHGAGVAARVRRAALLSLATFLCSTASVSAQSDKTLPPCSNLVSDADSLLAQAKSEGYTVVKTGEALSAKLIDQLQWIMAEPYMVGDSGGQSLAAILALANEKAVGLSNIEPSANATIRIVHSDQAVALLRWWKSADDNISVHCSGALFLDDTFYPPATSGRYGDYSSTPVDLGRPSVDVTSERYQLDRVAIRAELPEATPPHYIMGVQIRYNLEVLQ